jgi:hypothetical protein
VLPANPLSLPIAPPGVSGVFAAHMVALDATSGNVLGATIGGWSCRGAGPAQFDGSYPIEKLATGSSYLVYAEPLDGLVNPSQVSNATTSLCRNPVTDASWRPLQGCVVPAATTSFTTRAWSTVACESIGPH